MLKKYIIKREHLSMLLFICHLGGGGGGGGGGKYTISLKYRYMVFLILHVIPQHFKRKQFIFFLNY